LSDTISHQRKQKREDIFRGAAVAELNLPTPKSISPLTSIQEAHQIMTADDFDVLPG